MWEVEACGIGEGMHHVCEKRKIMGGSTFEQSCYVAIYETCLCQIAALPINHEFL